MSIDSQGIEPVNDSGSSELAATSSTGPFSPVSPDTAREIPSPFMLFDKDHPMMDLRMKPESVISNEEIESDPKGSSAPESVSSSSSRGTETTELPSESNAKQDETASAEKGNGRPKENEKSGTPIF